VTRRLVLGVGLASNATAAEVRSLVDRLLLEHGLRLDDVSCLATRERFADDERLRLGLPVVGYPDHVLAASSPPPQRAVGIRARVSETAALLAVTGRVPGHLVAEAHRSPHATAALAATDSGAR
jgi:cobalamin biosynthesis protein CbiG